MPVYIVKHLFTFSWFSAPLFDTKYWFFNIIYTPFYDVSICDVTLLPRYIVLKTLDVFCLVYYFVTTYTSVIYLLFYANTWF